MNSDENEVLSRIFKGYTDTEIIKIFVIACFVLLSVLVSIVAFNIPLKEWNYPGIFIVPQIYYIPILLISLWYPKKGMQVSILLISGFLGVSSYYYYLGLPIDPYIAGLNVAMFIWVVITTTYMAESSGLVNIKYRSFFRNAGAGMLILDINSMRILDANEKAVEILGINDSSIIGKRLEDLIENDQTDRELFYEIDNRKFIIHSGETAKTVLVSSHFNESLGHIECTILDITEQEKEKKGAEEIRMKMLEFLKSSNNYLFILDLKGNIKSFDRQITEGYEILTDGYVGKNVRGLLPSEFEDEFCRNFREVIKTGRTITFDTEITIKNEKKKILIILGAILSSEKTEEVLVAVHEIGNNLPEKDEFLLEFENRKWANFINTAAHELRTPLQPLLGYLHLLAEESCTKKMDPGVASIIRKCLISAERESEIVESILEAGLAESCNIKLNIEEIALKQLITEIVEINRIHGEAEILFDIPDSVRIKGDRDRIYQVFEGIILNAVKYNSHPKKIRIRFSEDELNNIIKITDNGRGIPSDCINEIFEPFFIKNTSDLVRGTGRIGLGLSIANRYVSLHNGEIEVQSVVGEGSTFTIIIPKEISLHIFPE